MKKQAKEEGKTAGTYPLLLKVTGTSICLFAPIFPQNDPSSAINLSFFDIFNFNCFLIEERSLKH